MSKSIYPSIPAPGNTIATLTPCVAAMRQALTLILMNAQSPNSNYAPSSASQVFVTYDELNKLNLQGEPGPPGQPGPPGPGIAEAPSDAHTYGRHALGWVAVLTATGAVFSSLPIDAPNDAAAAAAGVPVNGIYKNGSQLMVRVA